MVYIFARTERKLEWHCKIKNKDLRFERMSLWVFQFASWCVRELLVFCEYISRWFDLFCTSCMRRVFILCWHRRENKRLLMYRNIKSQEDFSFWVFKLMSFWVLSFWVFELVCFWVGAFFSFEFLSFEFLSWWVFKLMSFWVFELMRF